MSDLEWRGLTLKHEPPARPDETGSCGWEFWRFLEEDFVSVIAYRRPGEYAGTAAEFGAQIVWMHNDDQYFPGGSGDAATLLEALEKAFAGAVPSAKLYASALRRLGVEP